MYHRRAAISCDPRRKRCRRDNVDKTKGEREQGEDEERGGEDVVWRLVAKFQRKLMLRRGPSKIGLHRFASEVQQTPL